MTTPEFQAEGLALALKIIGALLTFFGTVLIALSGMAVKFMWDTAQSVSTIKEGMAATVARVDVHDGQIATIRDYLARNPLHAP